MACAGSSFAEPAQSCGVPRGTDETAAPSTRGFPETSGTPRAWRLSVDTLRRKERFAHEGLPSGRPGTTSGLPCDRHVFGCGRYGHNRSRSPEAQELEGSFHPGRPRTVAEPAIPTP